MQQTSVIAVNQETGHHMILWQNYQLENLLTLLASGGYEQQRAFLRKSSRFSRLALDISTSVYKGKNHQYTNDSSLQSLVHFPILWRHEPHSASKERDTLHINWRFCCLIPRRNSVELRLLVGVLKSQSNCSTSPTVLKE